MATTIFPRTGGQLASAGPRAWRRIGSYGRRPIQVGLASAGMPRGASLTVPGGRSMLREMLEYPVMQLAERVRNWVRRTVAEAVVNGASEGVADGIAKLEGGVPIVPGSSAQPAVASATPAQPESAVRGLPFPEALAVPPAPTKRGRGRPRKQLNHDSDRT